MKPRAFSLPAFATPLLLIIASASISCQSEKRAPPLAVDEEYHTQPPRDTMPNIMQAKLAHAQALLEGLALADFGQIERNAFALVQISQQASWMVHDSPSYFAMSQNFREAAQAMVIDAQAKRLDALSRDYGALTGSCIACHRYLQAEKPTLDMPGRVSLAR